MTEGKHRVSRRAVLGAGAAATAAAVAGTGAAAGKQASEAASAPPASEPAPAAAAVSLDYVCNMCGGNNVARDAWAAWDADEQDWSLGAAFDYAFCHDCEEETDLVEVDLATREPTGG